MKIVTYTGITDEGMKSLIDDISDLTVYAGANVNLNDLLEKVYQDAKFNYFYGMTYPSRCEIRISGMITKSGLDEYVQVRGLIYTVETVGESL